MIGARIWQVPLRYSRSGMMPTAPRSYLREDLYAITLAKYRRLCTSVRRGTWMPMGQFCANP